MQPQRVQVFLRCWANPYALALRAKDGPRMFAAGELRPMLSAASTPLNAMILLGVNCGFGNNDCGTLPLSVLDLANGWVNYH
jgi:hypothetical protein